MFERLLDQFEAWGVTHVSEPADQLAKDSRKPANAFWKGALTAPVVSLRPNPCRPWLKSTLKDWEEVTKLVWQADTGTESLWSLKDTQWSCVILSKGVNFGMVWEGFRLPTLYIIVCTWHIFDDMWHVMKNYHTYNSLGFRVGLGFA